MICSLFSIINDPQCGLVLKNLQWLVGEFLFVQTFSWVLQFLPFIRSRQWCNPLCHPELVNFFFFFSPRSRTEDANGFGGEDGELWVLSGGLVYIESLSGPLPNVGLFQSSILQELQGLELELASGSSQLIQRAFSRAKECGSPRVQRLCSVIYETNMD